MQDVNAPDSIVYVPQYLPSKTDTVFVPVDTNAIIRGYLAEVYGHHVLKDDSFAFVAFDYMLSRNQLQYIRNVQYQNRLPTQIINTTEINRANPKLNKIALGFNIRGNALCLDYGIKAFYIRRRMGYYGGYWINTKTTELGTAIIF